MFLFAILGWMIFGLIVGAISRYLVPGEQPMGLFRTMMLGIGGSLLGGFAGYLIVGGPMLQGAGWLGSIMGSVAVIAFSMRHGAKPVESKA